MGRVPRTTVCRSDVCLAELCGALAETLLIGAGELSRRRGEEAGHGVVIDAGLVLREDDKDDAVDGLAVDGVLEPLADDVHRDKDGVLRGIAKDARGEAAEGDGADAVLQGTAENVAVAAAKERLALADGTDGVNDVCSIGTREREKERGVWSGFTGTEKG